jgi:hypothetical protein
MLNEQKGNDHEGRVQGAQEIRRDQAPEVHEGYLAMATYPGQGWPTIEDQEPPKLSAIQEHKRDVLLAASERVRCSICGKAIRGEHVIVGHPVVEVRLGIAPADDRRHRRCHEEAANGSRR